MILRALTIRNSSSFLLLGARGTGKSRLLADLFTNENPLLIDLLLPRTYQMLLSDPESLTRLIEPAIKEKRSIIIDEVQRVPALLDLAHYHIEKSGARFALTGSSARKLRRGGANLLAGRAVTYNLFPFLEEELGDSFNLSRALNFGLLPRVATDVNDEDRILYLESYVDTYLSQEIIAEQAVRNLPPFQRFLAVAAQMSGRIINYSHIARDCLTDPSNVKNYFQILDDTLLGFQLPGFHHSIRKQQREAPKFYFFDMGVTRGLANQLRTAAQPGTYEWGRLFEQFIITQIRAGLDYQRARPSLSYLLTKDGAEIDLIVERTGEPTLCLEIKSGNIIHPGELSNLKALSARIPNAKPVCLYSGDEPQMLDGVEFLPFRRGLTDLRLVPKVNNRSSSPKNGI